MKRAVIFGGAPIDPAKQPPVPAASLYLCADAGLRLAQCLGVTPDWTVGDFDSLGHIPTGDDVAVVPAEKDDTDLALAVKYALAQGCQEMVLYGALGGRLDHTFANLQLLELLAHQGVQGILVDDAHWVTLQSPGTRQYPRRKGYFSLFSWSEVCEDVTVTGVLYPLAHGRLVRQFPLGVSNEITEEHATVTLGEGLLLVVYADLSYNTK